jgi:hypothetical protein
MLLSSSDLPLRDVSCLRGSRARNDETQEYLLAGESTAELEVVMNNDTRWNSTYFMTSRALVKQGDIRAFLVHPEVEKWLPEADMLKGDDWRFLAEIKNILEPFYLQTVRMQGWGNEGGNGRLWEVSTGMDYLLEHLEDFYHAVPDEAVGENTNSRVELARRRPDRNGRFLLDLGIVRWTYTRESQCKAPCQVVAWDNVKMDQASHQDHRQLTTWERITDAI